MMPDPQQRLAMRRRPEGVPMMRQTWGKLLFAHWPVPPEQLLARLPKGLELDLYEGQAWVSLSPFALWGVRLSFTPPIPLLSSFLEVNLRTYVHHRGQPGVLFLSLDTNSTTTVMGARALFHLPYHQAEQEQREEGPIFSFLSRRTADESLGLDVAYERGRPLGSGQPGSLDFFLTERYCLFTTDGDKLKRARIHHQPWPLESCRLLHLETTLTRPFGLSVPSTPPVLHYADELSVEVWPVEPADRPLASEAA